MGCGDVRLLKTIGSVDFTGQERAALNKLTMPRSGLLGAPHALHLVVRQHSLRPFNALAEHVLKRGVALALLDVLRDRGADHMRNRLTIDRRDRVQLL